MKKKKRGEGEDIKRGIHAEVSKTGGKQRDE